MKKNLFMVILFLILNINIVHASCSLEDQVKINNAAGAVNAVASRLDYSYEDHDDDLNEDITTNGYTGIVYVYNLTDAIYFEISDGTSREKYTSNDDVNGAVAVSTGSMAVVKNYTISIYSTNKACSSSAVRTIQVIIPRYNEYFESTYCADYPDYYYCGQFLNADLITYDDFLNGINEYAKTHAKKDESRKEGIIENTIQFVKKYWYIIIIGFVIISGLIIGIKKYQDEKRKKEIV